jgi:hypothetical protein
MIAGRGVARTRVTFESDEMDRSRNGLNSFFQRAPVYDVFWSLKGAALEPSGFSPGVSQRELREPEGEFPELELLCL